ncbi:MAG: arsenate reductase (glutaredoxin) [Alphaproteobacteria bacterium]|nr:arsenate reductase (glutaredoxin) [Alphaproteobacteria bacterium]
MEFWHNPRCSKSRQALAILREQGIEPDVRLYLDRAPDAAEITDVIAALGLETAHDLIRTCEPAYKAAGLSRDTSDAALIAAMAAHPKLIERPVVIHGRRAVIGRPPERVLELV